MREIKFRAFDKTTSKNGVMVPWSELKLFNCSDVFLPCEIDMPEVILMQFTGLKDENSVEIYEGDIIECEYYPELPTTKGIELIWRGYVKYGADASFHIYRTDKPGTYSVGYGGSAVKRWEIIGNIHEHSHLLK